MSTSLRRTVGALLGAAAVLVVAGWYDTVVLHSILVTGGNSFDMTQTAVALPVGYLLIAAGLLGIALLARWADSRLVDLAYLLVGAFFAFLFTLVWTVAVSVNGAPPVLPDPLPSFLGQTLTTTESGTLNAVAIIGAAMLLVGASRLVLSLRHRPARGTASARPAIGAPPTPAEAPEAVVGHGPT